MIEAVGIDAIYRGGDLDAGSAAFGFVLDWMGTFGLSLLALGGILLVASRAAGRNRTLVHLLIIATGVRVLRRTPVSERHPTAVREPVS